MHSVPRNKGCWWGMEPARGLESMAVLCGRTGQRDSFFSHTPTQVGLVCADPMPAIRRVNMFYVVDAATKRCGALTDFE
jgi:hypothetical protein